MTDEEKFTFCGTICLAARELGIYGRFQEDYFVWFDTMGRRKWSTPSGANRKDILFMACQSLTNYLCPQETATG
jgi:hypothetical protein